jgi:hypothetical protein
MYVWKRVFKVECIKIRGRWSAVFDPLLCVEDSFLLGVAVILLRELVIFITTLFLDVSGSYI